MGKRIAAAVLVTLAAYVIACGTTGAGAGGRQDSGSGGSASLDPGVIDYIDGAQGGLVAPIDGANFQP